MRNPGPQIKAHGSLQGGFSVTTAAVGKALPMDSGRSQKLK